MSVASVKVKMVSKSKYGMNCLVIVLIMQLLAYELFDTFGSMLFGEDWCMIPKTVYDVEKKYNMANKQNPVFITLKDANNSIQ